MEHSVASNYPHSDAKGRMQALAHPLRLMILIEIGADDMSPNELAERHDLDVKNLTYHFRTLEKHNLLTQVREIPRRGAREHFFRVNPGALLGAPEWRGVPDPLRLSVQGPALQLFADRAIAAMEAGTFAKRENSTISPRPIRVDEIGWKELVRLLDQTWREIGLIHERSGKRLEDGEGFPILTVLAGFEEAESRGRQGG
jgi:DNA-binding transcriptional ArsR family regulator